MTIRRPNLTIFETILLEMNVTITTFVSPFSFYCKAKAHHHQDEVAIAITERTKSEVADLKHGQYVAVWWKDSWARGVVDVKLQILIWLVDHGIHVHPDEKTTFVTLPTLYQKLPSKVFEATIHGVTPVDKIISDECEIKNVASTKWTQGATERATELIKTASRVLFVPMALLSTNTNDIVIGDLYLVIGKKYVNIIDELQAWPMFLERNKHVYMQSLSGYYGGRQRKHSACLLKPHLPGYELPTMIPTTTLDEYNAICDKYCAPLHVDDEGVSPDSSVTAGTYVDAVVTLPSSQKHNDYGLTAAQEVEYAHMWTVMQGKEYNILELVRQKLQVLIICDKDKYAKKGIGRANSRKKQRVNEVSEVL